MVNPETKEFLETWERKLAQANPGQLDGLFNKFNTLYTIYNRYYNEAFATLKAAKKIEKPRVSDFERATGIPLKFLGAKEIIDSVANNGDQENVDAVCQWIRLGIFNINLAEGQPVGGMDAQLLANLESVDVEAKAQAILSLIYNIRNNMTHGYKQFEEDQRLLVEPVISLLENIIQLFREKFKE